MELTREQANTRLEDILRELKPYVEITERMMKKKDVRKEPLTEEDEALIDDARHRISSFAEELNQLVLFLNSSGGPVLN